MKVNATLLSALALFALAGSSGLFAAESSCLDCHGNVDKMKALVPAPVASSSEGEG